MVSPVTSDWLDDFCRTVEHAGEQLLLITEEQAALPKAVGKWSPKQTIGHLIDSAANNHQRFVRAQFTDDLVCPAYDQDAWIEVQRYNEESWSQLVGLWQHYNLHLAHVMTAVAEQARTKLRTPHNLDRVAWQTVSTTEPVTLEYFMRDYVRHLQHHLDQIFAVM
ncbi:MAG: DinB family protein [Acidobacteriota bacterium]|nr:DinB family protein [Acidobacteriota bacterium]